MMFGLIPREEAFFELFKSAAHNMIEGSRLLKDMMEHYHSAVDQAKRIKEVEHVGDSITHDIVLRLNQTFITPIDREDIHQLISKMDDILDLIEDSAQLMFLYDVRDPTPEAKKLADICVACCEKVKTAVSLLSSMDNAPAIMALCNDIDRLESEADHVMRGAIARLFRDEPDVRELIKLRTVYEHLETVTDRCEDVANIIQGIVIENS